MQNQQQQQNQIPKILDKANPQYLCSQFPSLNHCQTSNDRYSQECIRTWLTICSVNKN